MVDPKAERSLFPQARQNLTVRCTRQLSAPQQQNKYRINTIVKTNEVCYNIYSISFITFLHTKKSIQKIALLVDRK